MKRRKRSVHSLVTWVGFNSIHHVTVKSGRISSSASKIEVRDLWEGPVVVKGILHPADAEQAISIGVDGIQVSNHGGRQFNGTPAAIDSLPAIVEVAKGKAAVLFDSGVRSGLDIMRALALGADFVLLGRAFQYGVAALGQPGCDLVTEILIADLKNNMSQTGCESLKDIHSLR